MPLRVLFLNPGRHLGGAEESLLLLIEGLRVRGVAPTVALFADGPFAARLVSRDIPVVFLDVAASVQRTTRYQSARRNLAGTAWLGVRSIPGIARLTAMIKRAQPDLIHTNGLKAHLLGGLAGRLAGRPVVWHLRDFPPDGFAGGLLKRAARSLPAVVLANSDAVAGAIKKAGAERPRVRRLYNPVDLDRFHPDRSGARIRAVLGIADDAPLVGMVAHLTPWKGHVDFLSIAMAVTTALPTARFLVAGGAIYETRGHAGYADALMRRTVDLGLGGRVLFLGAREDIPEILAALDVLVHCPTAPEPFGRGVAEAMAVGRPVVAARAGGTPEIVEHDVTGFLVTPGDVRGFTTAVLGLLRDPELRRRLGLAARQRAETLFPVGPHAERVIEAYRTLARE